VDGDNHPGQPVKNTLNTGRELTPMYYRSWGLICLVCSLAIGLARINCPFGLWVLISALLLWAIFDSKNLVSAVVFLTLALLAYAYYVWRIPEVPRGLAEKTMELKGVAREVKKDDSGERGSFVLCTDETDPYLKRVQIYFYFKAEVKKGDYLKVRGKLAPPEPPRNPGQFNYPRYLTDQHIFYVMALSNKDGIQVIKKNQKTGWLEAIREQGIQKIKTLLPEREAGILLGMLLGEKEEINEESYLSFQKTGIVHLFSVSGLHMGFIVWLCSWLFELISFSRNVKFWGTTLIIVLYSTLIGWPIPVRRAAVMAVLALLALHYGEKRKLADTLGLAGVLILAVNPADLFRISFQLSFLATWGIVYLYPSLKKRFDLKGKVADLIMVPLCAQAATLSLTAYYFNLFTPLAVIANIIVTYLAGVIVILGFLAFIFSGIADFLAAFFLYPAGFFIELIYTMVACLNSIPYGSIWVATPAWVSVLIYHLVLAGIAFYWQKAKDKKYNKRYEVLAALVLIGFVGWLLIPAGLFNRGKMEVVFLDVGQGDCVIIKTPRGRFMMVDGGGSEFSDVGRKRVLPYFHHKGIRSLEWIINTHPDTDHLQGVVAAAQELRVKCLGVPLSLINCSEYLPLKQIAGQKDIRFYGLAQGQSWQVDNCYIRVLHPPPGQYSGSDYNGQSLVLIISYQDFSMLLTGDIGSEVIMKLDGERQLSDVTLVKVPHHGSKNSFLPAFYARIKPELAVVQAARNNPFGHPHPAIINYLQQNHIQVLRNDLHGAVMVSSDGFSYSCRTYLGPYR